MDLSAPYLVVLSQSQGGVLSVLAGTTTGLSGREVARLSGGSRSTVARILQRLAEHGLVKVQEAGAGAALLYTLNRDHLAAEPVLALLRVRRQLQARLREELGNWPLPPLHASLFGSAARADGGTASDIDLFIIRPSAVAEEDSRWRSGLDRLPELVIRWTGNHAGIAEVAQDDIERLRRERPPVVAELERDAITLVGPPIQQILAGSSA